ncbi:uncharacterized protein LOC144470830 [Augochlora pura]
MKNGKLQNSIISIETKIPDSSQNYSASGTKRKCYKFLFSCFKVIRKKDSHESIFNQKSHESDYIVEKLVVKRVPSISFGLSKGILESENDHLNKKNESLLTTEERKTIFSNASKTQSILYYCDRINQNIITNVPSKYLYFHTNTSELQQSNIKEIMNAMNSLYPNLKDDEKLPKFSDTLHKPKNKTIFGTSSLRTEAYNQKYIKSSDNNEFQRNWKIAADNYKVLAENITSTNPSIITLRWKIVVHKAICSREEISSTREGTRP